MTSKAFAEVVALIDAEHGAFPDERKKLWWMAVRERPDEDVRNAVVRMLFECPFPPKIAHLMERLLPSKDDLEADAAYEWTHLLKRVRALKRLSWNTEAVKRYIDETWPAELDDGVWDRSTDRAVAALGGLRALADQDDGDLNRFTRKEFARLFAAFKMQDARFEVESGMEPAIAPPQRLKQLSGPSSKKTGEGADDAGDREDETA